MRALGVIVFSFLMVWTWKVVHSSAAVPFETHAGIQEKVGEMIVKTVQEKRPLAKEISVERVSTEVLPNGKLKVFFTYHFSDSIEDGSFVKNRIVGSGLLEKQETADQDERWILNDVKTSSDGLVFEQGLVISPGGKNTEPARAADASGAPNISGAKASPEDSGRPKDGANERPPGVTPPTAPPAPEEHHE